jgi:hydrogenase-4 component E
MIAPTPTTYRQVLDLAVGVMLVAAVVALWRRSLHAIVRALALQGAAVAAIALSVGVHHRASTDIAVAGLFALVKIAVIPGVLAGMVRAAPDQRETEPLVNTATTLLGTAVLTVVAFSATRALVGLGTTVESSVLPAAFAVVLIGFFAMVVRRNAVAQVVGFLLLENGIAAVALLASAGISIGVELAVALDLLLAVLVLQVLTTRMQAKFGGLELDHLSELRD